MDGPDADNEDQQALRERTAQVCDGLALIAEVSATTVDCSLPSDSECSPRWCAVVGSPR